MPPFVIATILGDHKPSPYWALPIVDAAPSAGTMPTSFTPKSLT